MPKSRRAGRGRQRARFQLVAVGRPASATTCRPAATSRGRARRLPPGSGSAAANRTSLTFSVWWSNKSGACGVRIHRAPRYARRLDAAVSDLELQRDARAEPSYAPGSEQEIVGGRRNSPARNRRGSRKKTTTTTGNRPRPRGRRSGAGSGRRPGHQPDFIRLSWTRRSEVLIFASLLWLICRVAFSWWTTMKACDWRSVAS